jgi:hypothetical protein
MNFILINSLVSNKIAFKVTLSVILTSMLFFNGNKSVYACTPPPITPWFSEQLSFADSNLPSTVSHLSELNFINTEDSPFYFLYDGEKKDMGKQLLFRISFGEFDGIYVNQYYFNEFEHRNKIGDNRPENTQPPGYQDVIIPVTLDEKQYAIKLRITYEINQNYNPKSIEQQDVDCSYGNPPLLYCLYPPVIIGLAFLTALIIVLIIVRKKSSDKSVD